MDDKRSSHYWPFHKGKPTFEELWSCHSVFGFSSLAHATRTKKRTTLQILVQINAWGTSSKVLHGFTFTYSLSLDLHGFFVSLRMPLPFRAHSLLLLLTALPLLKNLPPHQIINCLNGTFHCILPSLKVREKGENFKFRSGFVIQTVRWIHPHDKN